MEPQEIDGALLNNCLKGLVFFTGLDLSGGTSTSPHHNTIFAAFNEPKRERAAQIHYKMLMAGNELFRRDSMVSQQEKVKEPALKNTFRGFLKRKWPHKYLEERPALIVVWTDLDWDNAAWFEKRTGIESKINTLRQSIGPREIRLALVLIQRRKTSPDDPIAAEKAMEICQACRISSRHLYVFPVVSPADPRSIFECVGRLEMAFHEISQEAYQALFKRIRARNVPNNDPYLLIRQQFKLAFISELREDRHSANRYYKQAYQLCAEMEVPDLDSYELYTVASLLNYKICELNFLLNSPVESLNQFRKQTQAFLGREPGVYPSRELAAIELLWWKSQQCRLFAELFSRAVTNGLAAYPAQNPGRFFEEAAFHYKHANALVRQLRMTRANEQQQHQQRQTPPIQSGDPLQSIDLNAPTLFYGQRPWRFSSGFLLSTNRASSEPRRSSSGLGLAPVVGNPHLVEHAAKVFLEKNMHENYAHSIQLFSTAIAQFKRFHCARFATLASMDMADEYIASRQFAKALQILTMVLHHVVTELHASSLCPFLNAALTKLANSAFLCCDINEWIWAMVQLLHPAAGHIANGKGGGGGGSMAEEIREETWMGEAQKFLAGVCRLPFSIPHQQMDSLLFSREELDSARAQWHQKAVAAGPGQQQFQLDLGQHNKMSFIDCQMGFVTAALEDKLLLDMRDSSAAGQWCPTVRAGEPVPIEVILHNHSRVPLSFPSCSLLLERQHSSAVGGKMHLTLTDWVVCGGGNGGKKNAHILLPSGEQTRLLFLINPKFGPKSQQQPNPSLSPSSASSNRACCELVFHIRRFAIGSANGTFLWDIEGGGASADPTTASRDRHTPVMEGGEEANNWRSTIRVLPQRKKVQLLGPAEKIELFTDESIDLTFTLLNNDNDVGSSEEDSLMRNVRILCQKVYREEEHQQQQNDVLVQRRFTGASPRSHHHHQERQHGHGQQTTFVPVFDEEVATLLGKGESTDFSVRLQSKSANCIALCVQVFSTLQDGEPAEWTENFPVKCREAFQSEIKIYCENGEPAQALIPGQKYRLEACIRPQRGVSVSNVEWKLNSPSIGVCAEQALSARLLAQFNRVLAVQPKAKADDKANTNLRREEIWIEVRQSNNSIAYETEKQLALGDLVVEWRSSNSCEPVRSLVNLGQLALASSPVAIQAELLSISGTGEEDGCCIVGQPFEIRFTLLFSSDSDSQQNPLPICIGFEQMDGFAFSGLKEKFLTLFPCESYSFVQTFVPLCPGPLSFPTPSIRCANSIPGRPSLGFPIPTDELDRLNAQIAAHTFKALPASIFIM